MTLPSSGQLAMSQINAEFGRGNALNSYLSTPWWKDDGSSGVFSPNNLGFYEFYGKRATQPAGFTEFTGLGGYNTTGTTTQTASGVNFGAEAADRLIAVTGECHSGSTYNINCAVNSATIGGVQATVHCYNNNGATTNPWSACAFVISALVPAGTSGNVVINFSNTRANGYIDVYRMRGRSIVEYSKTTQSTTGTAAVPFNLAIAAGGLTLAGAFSGANTTSYSWTNMTRYSDVDKTTVRASGAYHSNLGGGAGTLTITSGMQGLRATAVVCFVST